METEHHWVMCGKNISRYSVLSWSPAIVTVLFTRTAHWFANILMLWIEQHNLFMVLFVVFSFESCDSTSIVECGYLIIYLLTVKTCHFSSVLFFQLVECFPVADWEASWLMIKLEGRNGSGAYQPSFFMVRYATENWYHILLHLYNVSTAPCEMKEHGVNMVRWWVHINTIILSTDRTLPQWTSFFIG